VRRGIGKGSAPQPEGLTFSLSGTLIGVTIGKTPQKGTSRNFPGHKNRTPKVRKGDSKQISWPKQKHEKQWGRVLQGPLRAIHRIGQPALERQAGKKCQASKVFKGNSSAATDLLTGKNRRENDSELKGTQHKLPSLGGGGASRG